MTDKPAPALFDPNQTQPATCAHCQAMRLPGQQRAITCAHDLDREQRKRPAGCLNRTDPATAPFPDGY